MDGLKNSNWRHRWKFIVGCTCILTGLIAWRVYPQEIAERVTFSCEPASTDIDKSLPTLPKTHFLVNDSYGWFDRTHFDTGQPGKVLADVQAAIANGGGVITIRQGVHDDVTGYEAVYRVSGSPAEADPTAIALGIYLDWSVRFETWQSRPPHGLIAPLSPFAIEDLPSQYLGFYAQAQHISIEKLFACYLGSVSGSNEGPPDFVSSTTTIAEDGWVGIVHLQNKTFTPLVETETGWQYVEWPQSMQMTSIASTPNTWQFLSETTWYLAG